MLINVMVKKLYFLENLSYENCLKTLLPLWNLDNLLDPAPILLDFTIEHGIAWTIFFIKKQFYCSKYAQTKEKCFRKW